MEGAEERATDTTDPLSLQWTAELGLAPASPPGMAAAVPRRSWVQNWQYSLQDWGGGLEQPKIGL